MKISPASQTAYTAEQKSRAIEPHSQPKNVSDGEFPTDSVRISDITDSKTLIQQTLFGKVSARIEEMLNTQGLSLSDAEGQDWSPEAVSQRIVDFTTGFYGMFKQQHPEMSDEEVVSAFESLVRGAVDDGSGQAMNVLTGQGMDGHVKGVVSETMQLVHSKLDEYFASLREQLSEPPAE
jgi:hypothetical protein